MPANLGSSVGISRVDSVAGVAGALEVAFKHDAKGVSEKGIDAREIECSVLGNETPEASVPGEIVPNREFYDYRAKYIDNASELIIPAPVTPEVAEEVQRVSVLAFQALDLPIQRNHHRMYWGKGLGNLVEHVF